MSSKGTWNDWLIYFLSGIAVQSEDVLFRTERINELLSQWKIQVASQASQVPVKIVERFAVNPYLTVNKIVKDLGISYSTAQRGLQKLEVAQIIKQIGGNRRNKIYCAQEILDILEEPAKIRPSEPGNATYSLI